MPICGERSGVSPASTPSTNPPAARRVPLQIDSTPLDNPGNTAAVLFNRVVRVPGAAWLRLFFQSDHLPPGSRLLITGLHHGWTPRRAPGQRRS